MTKKQNYTAPEAETLVVQAEGVICWSVNPTSLFLYSDWGTSSGAPGADLIQDKGYTF